MDSLSKRVRDAKPGPQPLSAREQQTLDDILAGRRTPRHQPVPERPRVKWVPILASVSTAVVAIVVLVVVFLVVARPQPALATTPNPLSVTPTGTTVATLREELMSGAPTPESIPSRPGAEWEGWYLQLDEHNRTPDFIQPQTTQLTWLPDGSGTTRIIAGTPSAADGSPISPLPAGAETSGVVVTDETFAPGEFVAPFPDQPPTDPDAMRAYLETYLGQGGTTTSYTAGDYLSAIVFLMQTWTLSDAAQRAAIDVILAAPGVQAAGTTTDRAGRAGLVLRIDATALDPLHRDELIIDPTTWHILADDRLYVGGSPDLPVPPGSVTEYTIWR